MDGHESRLKRLLAGSIQTRLLIGLTAAIVLVALVAGVASYREALGEAHDLQDDTLRQVAALAAVAPLTPATHLSAVVSDADARLIVQPLGAAVAGNTVVLPLPASLAEGLHTLRLDDTTYRIMVKTGPAGQRVAVAQRTEVRDEVAQSSAWRSVLPLLVLLPALWLVAILLVRSALRPVTALAAQADARADDDLRPLPLQSLPSEVSPFVAAINQLLRRVEQSMQTQRRFVADAAHELRSPMTALSLQAERLAAASSLGQAHERLVPLRLGIDRARHLLEQLLALARAQADKPLDSTTPISVASLFRQVLSDLMPLAESRHIDLGVREDSVDLSVATAESDLRRVVTNLVDNALRYTPEGGQVDLCARAEGPNVVIMVEDNGPGIAPDERDRVLQAFYRVNGTAAQGSGLGLSIVDTLLKKMGGHLELRHTERYPTGLQARALIPSSRAK